MTAPTASNHQPSARRGFALPGEVGWSGGGSGTDMRGGTLSRTPKRVAFVSAQSLGNAAAPLKTLRTPRGTVVLPLDETRGEARTDQHGF